MALSRSPSRTAALWLLSAIIPFNALLRGGSSWPVQAATALMSSVALFLVARSRRQDGASGIPRERVASILVVALGATTLFVCLQLVPLPPSILQLLSARSADVSLMALGPVGLFPSWRPLSLDPGATAIELAKLATWTMIAAASGFLATTRERREFLLKSMALSGVAVAVACFGAALAGFGRLTESRIAFLNPNHLSSFLVLTCWISLGFSLRARGFTRISWMAAFVIAASQVFLSLSRAGIAAFFVGAGVATVLAIRSGHATRAVDGLSATRPYRALQSLAAPIAIFATLAITAWLALDRVVGELRSLSEIDSDIKLSLWPLAWQAIQQFPAVGVGRGAFATVFPAYKVEVAQVTFTHLENTWLQIPLDIGLPAGLALLGAFTWAWVTGARSRDLPRPVIGALSGVAAVAMHELFDFSLELNGVAIPFLVILIVAAKDLPSLLVPAWGVRALAVVGLGLAALGFTLYLPHRAEIQIAKISEAETATEAIQAAVPSMEWHPADWVPPAIVGAKLVDEGRCAAGLEWLNRAMLRNPTAPQPHRSAARCLAAAGQMDAAKREYRLAFIYGDRTSLEEAFYALGESASLLDIAPDTPDGLMVAAGLLARFVTERPEEAREAYRRAWESFHLPTALAGLARATIACEQYDEALELARILQLESPTEPVGYIVASEALVKLERDEEAVKELERAAGLLPKRSEILFALGNRHLVAHRYSQAKLTYDRIIAREGRELSAKRLAIARALEYQGRLAEALKEARSAQESLPGEPGPLLAVSRLAQKSSLYEVSIDALERASRLPQAIPGAYDEQIQKLREERDAYRVRWIEKQARPAASQ